MVFGEGLNDAMTGCDLAKIVQNTVRGMWLLEEELRDKQRLTSRAKETAVGVLRPEHAQEGGKLGVVAKMQC